MSKIELHRPQALAKAESIDWDAPSEALARWAETGVFAASEDPNTISIFDSIGYDPWTGGGFNAKRLAGALRAIGNKDVTVAINSPGGDMFEGLAMYNMLADHPGAVTVKVMGVAASAASIIAMAGDEIQMGLGSFLMIHNAWGAVIGNQNDMREAADTFAQFDSAMADIYEHRSGMDKKTIAKMMDAETFMTAKDAVDMGFATSTFEAEKTEADPKVSADIRAKREFRAICAKAGKSRSETNQLWTNFFGTSGAANQGTHDAAETDKPSAVIDTAIAANLLSLFKS
jgi:ATP-dependent protease ClpP protease subunit